MIESLDVNFESTSSNIGRKLEFQRQDNKVGLIFLFVITKSPFEKLPSDSSMKLAANFFKQALET